MSGLLDALADGRKVCAVSICSGAEAAVEIAGGLGFKLLHLDARHAGVSPFSGELERLLRAADAVGAAAVVSLPDAHPGTINRALNDGADAIIVPDVRSAEDAAAAVSAARYPPAGRRGAAPVVRAARYGLTEWERYVATTNSARGVLASLESPEAMAQAKEILAVPGLDGVILDTFSLNLAAGKGARLTPGEVQDVRRAASEIQKVAGVLLPADTAEEWAGADWQLTIVNSDLAGFAQRTGQLRESLDWIPTSLTDRRVPA